MFLDYDAAQRPASVKPTYLSMVSSGLEGKQVNAHFNPRIELVSHPVGTDCTNCHTWAGWPHTKSEVSDVVDGTKYAGYQLAHGTTDPGLNTAIYSNNPIFDELLLLDFQWAASDRAGVPPVP